jgi:hypothetical protein
MAYLIIYQKVFDIVPSDMPGVEYASRIQFFGYQVRLLGIYSILEPSLMMRSPDLFQLASG